MGRKRIGQPRGVRHTVAGKFGQRLEQLATAAGLSTAEFARKAGVTEDAIRKYFRGTDVPRLNRWPRTSRSGGRTQTSVQARQPNNLNGPHVRPCR